MTHFIIIPKTPEEAALPGSVVALNIASLFTSSFSVPGWLSDVFAQLGDSHGQRSLRLLNGFLFNSQPKMTFSPPLLLCSRDRFVTAT